MTQKQDQNDVIFKISKVDIVDHSGNYSCVYSPQNYTLSAVAERGDNIIQILVIANSLPADISVARPPTVYEGDHVEFKCTLSDTLHTLNECQLIYSYLWKNETILQVKAFDVAQMEASFTIDGAVLRDSGHYSCTVLPSECIQEHEKKFYGKNTVFLEVNKEEEPHLLLRPLVIVPCGLTMLLLLFGLFLWRISNKQAGHTVSSDPREMSWQANSDVLEEQEDVEERDDVEAQSGVFTVESHLAVLFYFK
ncbi:uncharacterized protein LOC142383734 [Odontesthes bonariensis]|uniref:uncharacterized protein LOC142383734 n=1 Tax=Odontesthes bonariensis TaxID=219752 RepID=UPI003F5806AD